MRKYDVVVSDLRCPISGTRVRALVREWTLETDLLTFFFGSGRPDRAFKYVFVIVVTMTNDIRDTIMSCGWASGEVGKGTVLNDHNRSFSTVGSFLPNVAHDSPVIVRLFFRVYGL
ncbi:hypothetical protein EVAR_78726_1 [Eumeta japonica]|uniref:Uncharacterized protein n=1 Tax=Eumeta variegata TaxID=151549 RepID=A0A4C1T3T5_EUMVA|nr:hypothetical protein EVAR_78726_1 [Eumeta japonica]